jgi:signal peptidase I
MTKARRWIVRTLVVMAVVLPLSLVALYFLNPFGARSSDPRERILGYGIYRIPADSMAPAIVKGQIVFVQAGYYRGHAPRRGDIVTAFSPEIREPILKRVVGLPGETISMSNGRLLIDGRVVSEPYVSPGNNLSEYSLELAPTRIPAGHYYLLGDNRDNSSDSRIWGVLPRGDLLGRLAGQ